MSAHQKQTILEVAKALKSYGYTVYLAASGTYGFYTDGSKVVSFSVEYLGVNFCGTYRSKNCGTGWRIHSDGSLPNRETAAAYLAACPPNWALQGKPYEAVTPEQYLKTYVSSRFGVVS
jgi:hypothetical protein